MESKLAQSVVDYCVKKLNALDEGLGDLLKEAVSNPPKLIATPFKLDHEAAKRIAKELSPKPEKAKRTKSKFAEPNWQTYVTTTYEHMRENGKDYATCLLQLSSGMRRRGDGPYSLPELRKFLQDKGYDIPDAKHKGGKPKPTKLPEDNEAPDSRPTADELQLTGTPGWVRAEIIRLAALLNSPERIADMMQEWIDADSIVRILEEDRKRVIEAASYKDLDLRQRYINGLALAFNKSLGVTKEEV